MNTSTPTTEAPGMTLEEIVHALSTVWLNSAEGNALVSLARHVQRLESAQAPKAVPTERVKQHEYHIVTKVISRDGTEIGTGICEKLTIPPRSLGHRPYWNDGPHARLLTDAEIDKYVELLPAPAKAPEAERDVSQNYKSVGSSAWWRWVGTMYPAHAPSPPSAPPAGQPSERAMELAHEICHKLSPISSLRFTAGHVADLIDSEISEAVAKEREEIKAFANRYELTATCSDYGEGWKGCAITIIREINSRSRSASVGAEGGGK